MLSRHSACNKRRRRKSGNRLQSSDGGPTEIQGAVFDFDGVILDTETSLHTVWKSIFSEHGCDFTDEEWLTLIGTTAGDDLPYRWLSERSVTPIPALDQLRRIVSIRHRERIAELGPLPGVLDWLDAAHEQGLPVAVASSSPLRWVEPHLTTIGLRERFDAVICAGEGLPPKPAPDVYLAALGVEPRWSPGAAPRR